MSDATAKPRSLASALADVGSWRAEAEQKTKSELAEVDAEIESLLTAMQNLQQQLEALRRFRDEVARRDTSLGDEQSGKVYHAIFGALTDQAAALGARAAQVTAAFEQRKRTLDEAMANPDTAKRMAEYKQFKAVVEPTLAAMPESYRAIVVAHHEAQAKELQALIDLQNASVVRVDGASIAADIAVAVDSPSGAPEVLMLVLPVPDSVQTDWNKRPEDLNTWIAARVVQGVYSACEASGVMLPRAMYGGHQGLLAVEVEIGGAKADIGERVREAINVAARTDELAGAQVEVSARIVAVDNLLPPEDGAEGENGG
jgi:hypothetical protein